VSSEPSSVVGSIQRPISHTEAIKLNPFRQVSCKKHDEDFG